MAEKLRHQPPRMALNHVALSCRDLDVMVDFYTRVLGYLITDDGLLNGYRHVFLSLDHRHHHQLTLFPGKPDQCIRNTLYPDNGGELHHFAHRLETLADLQRMYRILEAEGCANLIALQFIGQWFISASDPEGNHLEFFVEAPEYVPQPQRLPLDYLFAPEADVLRRTQELADGIPGHQPFREWHRQARERFKDREPNFHDSDLGS